MAGAGMLSGIGGWAYPSSRDRIPVLKIEVIRAKDGSETFIMKNGVEFADYVRQVDVPGQPGRFALFMASKY